MNAFSSTHSRSNSDDTRSSRGSYQLILEHILAYPGTYEIPLRTMYTLNCAPRAQPLPTHLSRPGSPTPPQANGDSPVEAATAQFTSSLMNQISQLPSQPCSLPPSFINTFVRRCFVPELELVDFPQALTALDYLKDLEMRRRREIAATLGRLGVQRDMLDGNQKELVDTSPKVLVWTKGIESRERKVEALYTQLYVAIRRWIMINELMIKPFSKQNCVAMLNTLYPPVSPVQPTSALTPQVMKTQRDGFFKYIKAIERSGNTAVLDSLMQQGKRDQDENGWVAVRETLDRYLRVATSLIDECTRIHSPDDLDVDEDVDADADAKRKDRKADSGVSFGSQKGHSATGSTGSITSIDNYSRPLPTASAATQNPSAPADVNLVPTRSYSTLEKIANEFRRIKTRRKSDALAGKEATAISRSRNPASTTTEDLSTHARSRSGSLRKLRSFGDLRPSSRASSSHTKASGDIPAFDKDEMQRQRLLYEANANKNGTSQKLGSFFEL